MPITRDAAGMSLHPLRSTWHQMMRRCYESESKDYHNYGARGIRVTERWHNLRNFIEDMGERPSKDYQLDRIENDGNYEPGNCRWATREEQSANKRTVHKIFYKGKFCTGSEIARDIGITPESFYERMRNNNGDIFRPKKRALHQPKEAGHG